MPVFSNIIQRSALGFRPAVPGVGISDEGDGEAACPLHLLGQDLFHLRLLGLGALDDEFVVDLQDELGLQALGLEPSGHADHGQLHHVRRRALDGHVQRHPLAKGPEIEIGGV